MSEQLDEVETTEATGLSRRDLIKRAAIVGGVAVWGVPLIRLALDDDEGVSTAVAAAFPDTCDSTQLDPTNTVRLICAKTLSAAKSSFSAKVKGECNTKCGGAPCPTKTCRGAKMNPTVITGLVCVETGNLGGCPPELYGRNMKEWSCVAVVVCNCQCR